MEIDMNERRHYIGGSDVYDIIVGNRKKIIEDKLGIIRVDEKSNEILQKILKHGKLYEYTAHVMFLYHHKNEFDESEVEYCPPQKIHKDNERYRGHADALLKSRDTLIEYKCPTSRNLDPSQLKLKYYLQVQFYMQVYDCKEAIIWIYTKECCWEYRVKKCEETWKLIDKKLKQFLYNLSLYKKRKTLSVFKRRSISKIKEKLEQLKFEAWKSLYTIRKRKTAKTQL